MLNSGLRRSSSQLDMNGNTSSIEEDKMPTNMLEIRLKEEFGGHKRVSWKTEKSCLP